MNAKDGLSRLEQSGSDLVGDVSDGSGLTDKSLQIKLFSTQTKMQQRQMQRSNFKQGQEVIIVYSYKCAQRILFLYLVPYLQLSPFVCQKLHNNLISPISYLCILGTNFLHMFSSF